MQPLLVWRHFLPVLLFAGIASTKGTAASFLNSAKPDDFKRLNAAFADAVPEARQILRELERSAAIYQTFLAGQGWQSNLDRSRLAKEHFSTCYRQAQQKGETLPRALFKYGAYHARRGRNPLGVHDIGNLVSELAEGAGLRSFHLLVVCGRGTCNAYHPDTDVPADKQKTYNAIEAMAPIDVKPLVTAAGNDGWTLLDLRPLRPLLVEQKLKNLNRSFTETIWSYDAVLFIPAVHASSFFE